MPEPGQLTAFARRRSGWADADAPTYPSCRVIPIVRARRLSSTVRRLRVALRMVAAGLLCGVLAVLLVTIFGWNWLRAPIERMASASTGRVLRIGGDLTLRLDWPLPHLQATDVTVDNPPWANERHLFSAALIELTIDAEQLLGWNLVLPEVRLVRPILLLERGNDARKNWLGEHAARDETVRINVGRMIIEHGTLGYDDRGQATRIRAELSTAAPGRTSETELSFTARGRYMGLPLKIRGQGGPLLVKHATDVAYPLAIDATIGATSLRLSGRTSGWVNPSWMDIQLALSGDDLEQVFALAGIAFPRTSPYAIAGHLTLDKDSWRYEQMRLRVGASDIVGKLKLVSALPRSMVTADVESTLLDLADLDPMIDALSLVLRGATRGAELVQPATEWIRLRTARPMGPRRWDGLDADVRLKARSIRRGGTLALQDASVRLTLRDSQLKLDPLEFAMTGGRRRAVVWLDRGQPSMRVHSSCPHACLRSPVGDSLAGGKIQPRIGSGTLGRAWPTP